ncbi:hypothetical protein [Streptomyces sp. NPDC021622]|uniref:hypothetical protein n=1 Tax=Streptomyces sp. NPDC021622 TaxID=3155013 RepID=UPI0033CB2232
MTEENPALRERPVGDDADEQYTPPGGGAARLPQRAVSQTPVVIDMSLGSSVIYGRLLAVN